MDADHIGPAGKPYGQDVLTNPSDAIEALLLRAVNNVLGNNTVRIEKCLLGLILFT
jgi:hypothetical protein